MASETQDTPTPGQPDLPFLSEQEDLAAPVRSSWVPKVFFALLLLFFIAVSFGLQQGRSRQIMAYTIYQDNLFLPRREFARALTFGQDMLMADFLYLRAVQAFGAHYNSPSESYDPVFNFFGAITELDPHFIHVYEFGADVMDEGNATRRAIDFLKEGYGQNSGTYKIPYKIAYMANWRLEDKPLALLWCHLCQKTPDCPSYVTSWVTDILSGLERFETAIPMRVRQYLQYIELEALTGRPSDSENVTMQEIALINLQKISDLWYLNNLNLAAARYYEDHGKQPVSSLQELEKAGYLKDYRSCDYPKLRRFLDPANLYRLYEEQQKKNPELSFTDLADTIIAACVTSCSGIPVSPYKAPEENDFYFARQDVASEDYARLLQEKFVVLSSRQAREKLVTNFLPFMRTAIDKFYTENGRYPNPLTEAFEDGVLKAKDPITGTWNYDPKTGAIHSPSFPDL
ncbi:MAG TPA: hypothetical protein PLA90_00820 [Candidatus Sumerlaeota bacterium]|nr:hypothetical protein [Candidatus Sumerlaeota bacterium]